MTDEHPRVETPTPTEHTRQAIHRSIDIIITAWPRALNDANARGYTTGTDYNLRGNPENTTTEAAALNPPQAVAWLTELADVLIGFAINPLTTLNRHITSQAMHLQTDTMFVLENEHLVRRTIRLANYAALFWPPTPKPGTTTSGVTIGDKRKTASDAERCLFCHVDAHAGDRRAIKTLAGEIEGYVHTTPCWYAVMMSRGLHPRQKTT